MMQRSVWACIFCHNFKTKILDFESYLFIKKAKKFIEGSKIHITKIYVSLGTRVFFFDGHFVSFDSIHLYALLQACASSTNSHFYLLISICPIINELYHKKSSFLNTGPASPGLASSRL